MRLVVAIAFAAGVVLSSCAITGSTDSKKGTHYQAQFSGQLTATVAQNVTCSSSTPVSGVVDLYLQQSGTTITGEGDVSVTETGGPASPVGCGPYPARKWDGSGALTGTTSSFTFSHQYSDGTAYVVVTRSTFVGAISGDVVTGTLNITNTGRGVAPGTTAPTNEDAAAQITLSFVRK